MRLKQGKAFTNSEIKMIISFFPLREQKGDLIRDALQFMYTPWPDSSDKYALRTQLVDLIGDQPFYAPSHAVADIHSKYADVYMSMFDYQQKVRPLHKAWYGVQHGDNVFF